MPKRYECAVAYLRTSSAANVGPDKDSDKRQRTAIAAFARRAGKYRKVESDMSSVPRAEPERILPIDLPMHQKETSLRCGRSFARNSIHASRPVRSRQGRAA